MLRYHMQKKGLMIESDRREWLEVCRRRDLRFSRARIIQVLQLKPEDVTLFTVYKIGGGPA